MECAMQVMPHAATLPLSGNDFKFKYETELANV